jgi:hypothetical protein
MKPLLRWGGAITNSLETADVRWLVTLFWLWWTTLLCVMSLWEQFSSQMVHHPISPVVFVSLWTGVSLSLDRRMGTHSLASSFPRFGSSAFFLLWVCKGHGLLRITAKSERVAWQNRQRCTMRLQIPGKKLNIVLMCVLPIMVPILTSAEHTDFVRPSVKNVSVSPIQFMVANICFILLSSKDWHLY